MVQRKRYNKRSQKAKNTTRKNTMRKNTRRKNTMRKNTRRKNNYKKTNKRNLNRRSLKNKKNNKRNAHLQKGGSVVGSGGRIGCGQDRKLYGECTRCDSSPCEPRDHSKRGEGYYDVGNGMIYDDFGTKCHKSCFMEKNYKTNRRVVSDGTTVKCHSWFKNIYEKLLTIYTAKKKSSGEIVSDEGEDAPENNAYINYITENHPDTIITKIIELLNGLSFSDSILKPHLEEILGGYYELIPTGKEPRILNILDDLNEIKKDWGLRGLEMKQADILPSFARDRNGEFISRK